MTTLPRIGIVSFAPLATDARVLRQAEYLSVHFDVTVVALPPMPSGRRNFKTRELPSDDGMLSGAAATIGLIAGRIVPDTYALWREARDSRRAASAILREEQFDLICANEWPALFVALSSPRRVPVVFDAHEYSPEESNSTVFRALRAPLVRRVLRDAARRGITGTTVSGEIADRFMAEFGLSLIPVLSAPKAIDLPPSRATQSSVVRMVHHGAALRERRLEIMIEALAEAEHRFELTMMLIGDPAYIDDLRARAARRAPGRVSFVDPVAPDRIVERLIEFDLGIFILETSIPNYAMAMPNKLFDYIGAGLGVVLGPSPAMAALGREYGFACVADDFSPASVGRALNRLTPMGIDELKDAARRAGRTLNADVEMRKLVDLIRQQLTPQ